jgi:Ni/Co efflux regulator RcnB
MKTKILIAILTVGVFSISTMKAQEKPMNMEQDTMQMDHSKMDHSKMEMKHDSTEMKMDHSKMEMNHDSTEMKMDDSKMTKTFVCPMHPGVTSDKPGECPKCGMDMAEKKMDMKKEDTPKKHKH